MKATYFALAFLCLINSANALTFGKDGKVFIEGLPDSATPEPFLSKVAKTELLKLR